MLKNNLMGRNFGIDLLKIFAMINVLILHINRYSGDLNLKYYSPKYKCIWLLEIMSYWSVNGFGIISGIIGYKKYKFSNLIYLWIQTCFYSSLFSLIVFLKTNSISKKNLILSLFPILIQRQWYVNAYFFMYPFLPFINYGIQYLNKKKFRNIILFLLFFCSILDIIGTIVIGKTNYNILYYYDNNIF